MSVTCSTTRVSPATASLTTARLAISRVRTIARGRKLTCPIVKVKKATCSLNDNAGKELVSAWDVNVTVCWSMCQKIISSMVFNNNALVFVHAVEHVYLLICFELQ